MPNQPILYTFHQVRTQCEQGDAAAWRAFLDLYGPLSIRLLELYLPEPDAAPRVLETVLASLAANNYERFGATDRQSEREFLSDVRALLLETATPPAADGAERALTPEKLAPLLEGLPLVHQEMLFLRLAGYTEATIEHMTRIAPRVAEKAFERLAADYSAALASQTDRCVWPAEWLALLRAARAAKTDKCPPLHQFLRIHDGQVSWYDKEPVEKHVTGCLHCLDRWTALREVGYWRRQAAPLSPAQIEQFLRAVPVVAPPKPSLLGRVFGQRG
jgi:hypothetical protein